MKDGLVKTSEVLVNISIVVVAILLGIVLVKNYLLPGNDLTADSTIRRGTSLSVPDVDWTKANQTFVLILSENCRYCTDSAPFYRRLVERAADRRNRVIAALPQDVSVGRAYLDRLSLSVDQIVQVSPTSIGTRATPTLVLVDNSGVVKDVWIGQLSSQKETEVLGRL